jgi:hypothetical protein
MKHVKKVFLGLGGIATAPDLHEEQATTGTLKSGNRGLFAVDAVW